MVLPVSSTPQDLERYRPRLLGLTYRMLGDMHEAEDVVQDAMARWVEHDRQDVASPEGWLVTVATRLAIDRIRRLVAERKTYVGPWLPEPISIEAAPDRGAELASDLSFALLVLLERLSPEERAALVLRDALGTDYADIARILERSEPAVRQLLHRARERVRTPRARFSVAPDEARRMLQSFLDAMEAEDRDAIMKLLAPDVEYVSDSGGVVRSARRIVEGSDHVARLIVGIERKPAHAGEVHCAWEVNGGPGYLVLRDDVVVAAVAIDIGPEGIRGFYKVVNPRKLQAFGKRMRLRVE
jgi:RNA polymerase sigma-70 factor (ECF subfamily)